MTMTESELRNRKTINSNIDSNLEVKYENLVTNEKEKYLTDKQQQTSNNQSTLSLENICWLIASIACIYFSDIIKILLNDQRINRRLMVASFVLIGINVLIAIYMIIWLTYFKKIKPNDWSDKYPFLIPMATACFITGSILLLISIWPVYTWYSAPLLFTIFMGFIVVIINIPSV